MMKVDSKSGFSAFQKFMLSWKRRVHHRTVSEINISDGEQTMGFRCRSAIEENSVASLLTKEAGTIRWLKGSLSPGDIFLDVGANIGIYSIYAAHLVGDRGRVYAVEPHTVNFAALLQNIQLNGLLNVCIPMSSALSDEPAYLPFYYASLTPGSSMSQLGQSMRGDETDLSRRVVETKSATSLDLLVHDQVIEAPTHIKIDVDGTEAMVVRGMGRLLSSADGPRTVQVEVQPDTNAAVVELMDECGYSISERHYTAHGQEQLDAWATPNEITRNVVFVK